jgi:hypothetical protein
MAQASKNHRSGHLFRLPPRWQWIFRPVIILSGGVTVFSLWMQEKIIQWVEFVPFIAIPGLAAILYWFNHRLFKVCMPCPDDLKTSSNRNNLQGEKDSRDEYKNSMA